MIDEQVATPQVENLRTEALDWAGRVSEALAKRQQGSAVAAIKAEIDRPDKARTVVIVAGEDKRGKSSLVNALMARKDLSPVGVEVTTGSPITFYKADHEVGFVNFYGDAGRQQLEVDEARELATVQGNPGNEKNVRGVSLGVDCPFLRGMLLIDTPGVGGLESGHAALTLQQLKGADVLLFVTDASAQLRSEELKFLRKAASRIDRVVIVLTKVDKFRGWKQTLEDNRAILKEKAPRFENCPIIAVSSVLAQKSLSISGPMGQELWAESGLGILQDTVSAQVGGNVDLVRAANLVRSCLGPLGDVERATDARVRALSSKSQAQQQIAELQASLAAIGRERSEWPFKMQNVLRRIGFDRTEEISRGILELRSRYEERLKEVKPSEHDTMPGEFVADLTAIVAGVNEWTQQRIIDLVIALVGDTVEADLISGPLRQVTDSAFADDLAASSLGDVSLDTTEKISVVQSYSSGHSLASVVAMSSMAVIGAPVALALGVAMGGAMAYVRFHNTKRSNFVVEFKSWMGDQVQRAQIAVNNGFQRAQLDLEMGLRETLNDVFAERDSDIRKSIAECQQLAKKEQGARDSELKVERVSLGEIRDLKKLGQSILGKTRPSDTETGD